jgi:hypothetical protein
MERLLKCLDDLDDLLGRFSRAGARRHRDLAAGWQASSRRSAPWCVLGPPDLLAAP